eukprot:GHVT01100102.1.p1 GENE.GHVT01100102.1~~GHVT01100102.1.p1  ORF type:complete len:176 (+),score=10.75 GHVT01100102.1:77-529(+)
MEVEDILLIGIQPLAQQRVLKSILQKEKAPEAPVRSQDTPQPARPAHQATPDVMADINNQLGSLLGEWTVDRGQLKPSRDNQPSNMAGERVSLNPLTYLLPPASTKFHEITNYVQFEEGEEEQELWENGTSRVVLKATNRKIKLETVSPM